MSVAGSGAELLPALSRSRARNPRRDGANELYHQLRRRGDKLDGVGMHGFADDFRGSSRPGRIVLLADEPPSTGDLRFDAALAGVAEFFASEGMISAPSWVNGSGRFVEPWWFAASRPAFHAYTLANSPAAFSRHGVFIAREVFSRV